MSQSFQPRMPNGGPKNTPITRIGTATVPFSQGLQYQSDTSEQPEQQIQEQTIVQDTETLNELVPEKTAANVEPEQQVEVPEIKVPDFTYGRSLSTSFCMRCGGQAQYFGKSTRLNFSKKLCADCVAYYASTLNV